MTKTPPKGRWDGLLEDADVRRWYENARRSSIHTATNYLGCLGRSLELVGHTPRSLVALGQKERDDVLTDILSELESPRDGSAPLAPGSVHLRMSALASWLKWNRCPPTRNLKITNRGWQPKAEAYNILTQDQVRRFYSVAGIRARVAGAFVNFCGARPEVLGWIDGSKGLRLKHLPELTLGDGFDVESTPMRVEVPRDLNKGRRGYTTFLGAQGTAYLLAYLDARRNAGEELGPESPVLTDSSNSGKFLVTSSITRLLRRAFDKAGIPEPPYILKSVWMNRAINAEADGFTSTYRTFCVGHAGTLAHTYGLRKQLDVDTLERLRTAYAAALRHMETEAVATVEDPVRELWAMVLADTGNEDVSLDSLRGKSDVEVRELVAARFKETQAAAPVVTRQEVVPLGDVAARLGSGWRFVANLGDGTAIVEGSA